MLLLIIALAAFVFLLLDDRHIHPPHVDRCVNPPFHRGDRCSRPQPDRPVPLLNCNIPPLHRHFLIFSIACSNSS